MSKRLSSSQLSSSTVGFDRLFELIESTVSHASAATFPPYNITRRTDDELSYRITLAVAGYSKDQIRITQKEHQLVIEGSPSESDPQIEYLFKGVTQKSFTRKILLSEYAVVQKSSMNDGLLHIDVTTVLPEKMKPRNIEIS